MNISGYYYENIVIYAKEKISRLKYLWDQAGSCY